MEPTHYGQLNIIWGWIWMILGITTGSIIGMWAFDGPFKPPKGHENYASLSRRLARLGHIAFFALPMISILYGLTIDRLQLSPTLKQVGSYSFLGCMMGLPMLLMLAAYRPKIKYLTPIPVACGFLGLGIIFWGNLLIILG